MKTEILKLNLLWHKLWKSDFKKLFLNFYYWMNKNIYKTFQSYNDCIMKIELCAKYGTPWRWPSGLAAVGEKQSFTDGGVFSTMWGMKWNSLLRSGTDECCTSCILLTTSLCKMAAHIFVSSNQILASGRLGQIGRIAAACPRAFLAWTWNSMSWLEGLPGRLLGRHLLCEVRHSAISVLN